jgi:hypothetical protein
MNSYQRKKEQVRLEAQEWQEQFSEGSKYWSEIIEAEERFLKLAKRYGLITEFKEEGIL